MSTKHASSRKVAKEVVNMRKVNYPEHDVKKDITSLLVFFNNTLPEECWDETLATETGFRQYVKDIEDFPDDERIDILLKLETLKYYKDVNPDDYLRCVNEVIENDTNLILVSKYLTLNYPDIFAISEWNRGKLLNKHKSQFERHVDFCHAHPTLIIMLMRACKKDGKYNYSYSMTDEDAIEAMIKDSRDGKSDFIDFLIKSELPYSIRKNNIRVADIFGIWIDK